MPGVQYEDTDAGILPTALTINALPLAQAEENGSGEVIDQNVKRA